MEELSTKVKEEVSGGGGEPEVGYTHVLCCPGCPFLTLSAASLNQHALVHDRPPLSAYRTYTCSKCLSLSTERALMLEHISVYHRNTKRQVELTEEVHTIIRKEEPMEVSGYPFSIEVGRDDASQRSKKKHSPTRMVKKSNWRSRIKRIKDLRGRRTGLRPSSQSAPAAADDLDGDCPDQDPPTEDGPIDMSVRGGQQPSTGVPTTAVPPAYPPSGKCPLLEALGKSPLTATLSNPLLMRYLSSQMHSLGGAGRFFGLDPFLQQRGVLFPEGRMPPTEGSLYHGTQMKIAMSKGCSDSESTETPHRSLHRNNFSPFQNHILLEWYDKHKNKPYPSTEDTKHLSDLCGLSYPQVKKWFANKRARSTFYQKSDIGPSDHDLHCDMLRYPLRVTDRLKAMEAQFRHSLDTKMPSESDQSPPMSLH